MDGFIGRMVRAAKLDPAVYEEVEADKNSMGQAMWVVILSSLAAGLGAYHRGAFPGLVAGTVSALLGWFIWAYITYYIGKRFFAQPQTHVNYGELLRTIGFSSSPGVIRVFGLIPGLSGTIFFAASLWMLVAMVIAVRQALDFTSTLRAVAVCAVGWLFQVFVMVVLFFFFGGLRAAHPG